MPSKSALINAPNGSESWNTEILFSDGDSFFRSLLESIESAKSSIEFEFYILADDEIGHRFSTALVAAAKRGVTVRVLVDGIGSLGSNLVFGELFRKSGVAYRVFHRVPWESSSVNSEGFLKYVARSLRLFQKINTRNHRKLCVVDAKRAYIGSINIWAVHSQELSGDEAWRDVGVAVEGAAVQDLQISFEMLWGRRPWRRFFPLGLRHYLKRHASKLVRVNITRALRRRNYTDFRRRIVAAKDRVWITNAYFIPHHSLIAALKLAASRGIDVRVIVSSKSDIIFIPWAISAYSYGLLKAGVRVYEYLPSVLHAKTTIIDTWHLVGSSNLNHRSLFHDFETDVVITHTDTMGKLRENFLADFANSRELTKTEWTSQNVWKRILGRMALLFRYWM